MRHLKTILLAASFVITSASFAAGPADLYVIPIAGHASGAFGTEWRSDVVLHNFQLVPITVELAFVESGHPAGLDAPAVSVGAGTVVHLAASETRVIDDVLESMDHDASGALIVGGSMPFALTTRTWARHRGGRTLGQTVQPIAIAGGADTIADRAVLPGLHRLASQRANIGLFVAASRAPFIAEIELVSATGAIVGSHLVALETEGFAHRQIAIDPEADVVSAIVGIHQGDGVVVPYGSVIDNTTAEALFIAADPASSQGNDARAMLSSVVQAVANE